MVTNKQRQRQLARAKWERQAQRRGRKVQRQRRAGVTLGVAGAVVVVALLGWMVVHIVHDEQASNQQPSPVQQPTPTSGTASQPTQSGSHTPQTGSPTASSTAHKPSASGKSTPNGRGKDSTATRATP